MVRNCSKKYCGVFKNYIVYIIDIYHSQSYDNCQSSYRKGKEIPSDMWYYHVDDTSGIIYLLKMGMHAYVVFIVHFCMEAICQVARMLLLRNLIQLSIKQYLLHIYKPIFLVVALSVVIPYIVYSNMDSCFLRLVIVGMACVISVGAMSFFFGLEKSERQFLKNKIMNRVKMR